MGQQTNTTEGGLAAYIAAAEKLRHGQFDLDDLPVAPRDDLARLSDNLKALALALEVSGAEWQRLSQITTDINDGFLLDEILDRIYVDFHDFIPYDRMGVSIIDDATQTVTAIWARSANPRMRIRKGYSARLPGSSLQAILDTGHPRIINDLQQYLREKPESYSTKLALSEGIRSSITCPLVANGRPIGFMFFSSSEPNTYSDAHISLYQNISNQLAVIVEKGLLTAQNNSQKVVIDRQREAIEALRRGLARIRMTAAPFTHCDDPTDSAAGALNDIHREADALLDVIYRINKPS